MLCKMGKATLFSIFHSQNFLNYAARGYKLIENRNAKYVFTSGHLKSTNDKWFVIVSVYSKIVR